MTFYKKLCPVCAWREFCQKRFLYSSDTSPNCPDFTRDLTIKEKEKEDNKDPQIAEK